MPHPGIAIAWMWHDSVFAAKNGIVTHFPASNSDSGVSIERKCAVRGCWQGVGCLTIRNLPPNLESCDNAYPPTNQMRTPANAPRLQRCPETNRRLHCIRKIPNPPMADWGLLMPISRKQTIQARHTSLPAAFAAATSASSCSSVPSTSPLMNSSTRRRASPSSCCTAGDFMK